MPIAAEFDSRTKNLLIRGSGMVTFEEILKLFVDYIEAPPASNVRTSIIDFTSASDDEMNMTGAERLGEVTKTLSDRLTPRRTAFVCTNYTWAGLAKVYSMVDVPDREFKVFRSFEQAIAWTEEVAEQAA